MAEIFELFSSLNVWALMFVGVLWGMLVGALPGVAGTLSLVLLLPFTFFMPMLHGLIILMSAYTSSIYGGSISAILLGIPGTGGNIVTTFDGYPMAQQGRAGLALGGAAIASFVGNIFTSLLFIAVGPVYVGFALKFGTHEMFMVALWGFVISVIISPGSKAKGFIMGCVGVVFSCIGIGLKYGIERFTWGSEYLWGGVPMVPAIVGIFGVAVILQNIVGQKDLITIVRQRAPKLSGIKELAQAWTWGIMMFSSLLGFVIGCIPGTGSIVATLIGYGIFKKVSKLGKEYGKGCYEGILIAESANNSTHPGAVLTTLILGVPGTGELVILLGAFTIHGLRAGPLLLVQHPEMLYTIFISFILSSIITLVVAWTTLRAWVRAIETPKTFIWPIILLLCITGTYSIHSNMKDVLIMLGIGVFAWWGERSGFSKIPLMMGLVLGPIMEESLRLSLQLAPPQAFLTKPIAMALLIILLTTCFAFLWVLRAPEEGRKTEIHGPNSRSNRQG